MNTIDLIIVAIFIVTIIICAKKGMISSLVRMGSFIISIFIANKLYPAVSSILRNNAGFYNKLYYAVNQKLNFDTKFEDVGRANQNQFIQNLGLPDFLTEKLIENNNIEVYKLLDTSVIEDYITGAMTNFLLNIISMILVFILTLIIVNAIGNFFNLFAKLPVIKTLNGLGGAVVGVVIATVLVWCFLLISFFFSSSFISNIQGSVLGIFFIKNNLLLSLLLDGFI